MDAPKDRIAGAPPYSEDSKPPLANSKIEDSFLEDRKTPEWWERYSVTGASAPTERNSSTLPPFAVVLTVMVFSTAKRCR